jgi:hypothetical protein
MMWGRFPGRLAAAYRKKLSRDPERAADTPARTQQTASAAQLVFAGMRIGCDAEYLRGA